MQPPTIRRAICLRQPRRALNQGDYLAAYGLAQKAKVISDRLVALRILSTVYAQRSSPDWRAQLRGVFTWSAVQSPEAVCQEGIESLTADGEARN